MKEHGGKAESACCGGNAAKETEGEVEKTGASAPWYSKLETRGASVLTPSCCSSEAPCIPESVYGA
jgi:hypothetical protein